jgi:hypothetical protein
VGDDAPAELPGARSVCVSVSALGTEYWHVRFEQFQRKFAAERGYRVTLWAKAERPAAVRVSLEQSHQPWHELGMLGTLDLTPQWQRFSLVTRATESDDDARLVFDPPMQTGRLWLAGVSLRPGGVEGLADGESLEAGSVASLPYAGIGRRSAEAITDWCRFLWETEDAYWQAMDRCLRDELKVRGLVIGTIVGCSTPNLMAKIGVIDGHAYWQHPQFPGRPWDQDNWIVHNLSMVNARGGLITELALKRVLNLPFCTTEYGEPAPNTHVSEDHLLRAAYGCLQDWDYISASRFAQRNDFDRRSIRGWFDIDQHPTSMASLLPAAAIFRRGDVAPAKQEVVASLDKATELALLPRMHAWDLGDLGARGISPETALVHRVALAVEGQTVPRDALTPDQARTTGDRFVSDTGELDWDLRQAGHGVVTVNTSRSKAVIGYGGGRRFELGGVVIAPGPTRQEGWSAITLTAMQGDLATAPAHLLITATGWVENTNMGWKNPEHSTVGRDWGTAPTLVEGIPARFELPFAANRVSAWALDERGQRREPVPCQAGADGRAALDIGAAWRTLWYEVEVK